jgi:hypothetical protein
MIPDIVRKKSNPFILTTRLSQNQFVGREEETSKLKYILEEYQKTINLKNLLVSGEKSIGKSTLLNKYKQILQDYNFIVYEMELPRHSSVEINEFEFFRDLINELFTKFAPPNGAFFDTEQSEIWFSLTSNQYEHKSNFKDRKIALASQYANYKKGRPEKLSFKTIEMDFEQIINQLVSVNMETKGFAVIIDEFQELSRNTLILDILRQVSEKMTGLMIVGAGLPIFLDNPIFEKFARTAELVNLTRMSNKEVADLIFGPMEDVFYYNRHEIRQWFDPESFAQVIIRGGGNPLHVKILSSRMLDYYKNHDEAPLIELNKSVMEDVMIYYSAISEKSRVIRLALESCSKDQLESFSLLYRYEGFSLRATILLLMAFDHICLETEVRARNTLVRAFEDIWDLGLFEFNDKSITLKQIEGMSPSSLSAIVYNFIGDTIDKLYAFYFYEELTNHRLSHNENRTFEDALAGKLASGFQQILEQEHIPSQAFLRPLIQVGSEFGDHIECATDFIKDLELLAKTNLEEIKKDKTLESVSAISKKYDLSQLAFMASHLQFHGYFVIVAEIKVRGKTKCIATYFPMVEVFDSESARLRQISNIAIDKTVLEQYFISINSTYLYCLSVQPLLIVKAVDNMAELRTLYACVSQRDFNQAVDIAQNIVALDTKLLSRNKIEFRMGSLNDYGFCLINIGSTDKAIDILEKCCEKVLISNVNLAYAHYLKNDWPKAKHLLNRIIRKHLDDPNGASFIHLAINHSKLLQGNRIVENVSLHNIACWNCALISRQENADVSVVNSHLKKARPKNAGEHLYDRRVRYWLRYYDGNIPDALKDAELARLNAQKDQHIYEDISRDIDIFTSETSHIYNNEGGLGT